MRKSKYDKKSEKEIMRLLDVAVKKHGLAEVRHAANKWCCAMRAKASLAKARRELEHRLEEVNRKLAA